MASTAGRVSRAGSGAYSASKFALAGWSDALHLEERDHGVHVGLVLPGFIPTEGFPAQRNFPHTRWTVSDARAGRRGDRRAGWARGQAERYVPRPYRLAAILRILAPRLTRRVLGGSSADRLVTKTGADEVGSA